MRRRLKEILEGAQYSGTVGEEETVEDDNELQFEEEVIALDYLDEVCTCICRVNVQVNLCCISIESVSYTHLTLPTIYSV